MVVALVTGFAGLIGSETVRFFSNKGFDITGIDNNRRMHFFGEEASTEWSRAKLEVEIDNFYYC
jgi:CDP-paratose 2-epimerase